MKAFPFPNSFMFWGLRVWVRERNSLSLRTCCLLYSMNSGNECLWRAGYISKIFIFIALQMTSYPEVINYQFLELLYD